MKQTTWQERFDENKFSWYYKDNASGFCFLNEKEIKSFILSELSALAKKMIEKIDKLIKKNIRINDENSDTLDLLLSQIRQAQMEVLKDNGIIL